MGFMCECVFTALATIQAAHHRICITWSTTDGLERSKVKQGDTIR